MTFFVEKKLALGTIRFGVAQRASSERIDMDPQLSTGKTGEFIRRRAGEGFYFGGQDRFTAPAVPIAPTIRSTPFPTSLLRRRGLLALGIAGVLFALLGFAVVARKGPQGWVEVLLGAAMIATPIVMTAQERRKIHEQEERERAEREATEARNRQMLASYTAGLERLQSDRSNNAFEALENERPDLPYEIWSPLAQRVTLLLGFDELANWGADQAREVTKLIDRAASASGLKPEDTARVKVDLYRTVLWHLLADDRYGPTQQEQLASIRRGFGIEETDAQSIADFERLRGLMPTNLPRVQCTTRLEFKEYCVHETKSADGKVHVTNKRVVIEGDKQRAFPLSSLSDVNVDIDDGSAFARTPKAKRPLRIRAADVVFTAGMIDLASAIDERPRGFA